MNEERTMRFNRKGFTLVEMLVVIAIIAVLVSIIVPVVSNATRKAHAATDAANLRSVLGTLNVEVVNGEKTVQEIINASPNPTSKMDPGAILNAVFETPGFVDVYYVNGSTYYGLDYLTDVAEKGESDLSTAKPDIPGGIWYPVSNSK